MPDAITALISAGARVSRSNDKQQTALHFSVGGGCPRCVQQLLGARAKINYKDTESNTALILAAKLGNTDITAMLLGERANPNIKVSVCRMFDVVSAAASMLDAVWLGATEMLACHQHVKCQWFL